MRQAACGVGDGEIHECYSRSSTTPIFGWKSMSVSCQRAKGSLGVSCNTRKAMLMVCSGEKPAGWINLTGEGERRVTLQHVKGNLLHRPGLEAKPEKKKCEMLWLLLQSYQMIGLISVVLFIYHVNLLDTAAQTLQGRSLINVT